MEDTRRGNIDANSKYYKEDQKVISYDLISEYRREGGLRINGILKKSGAGMPLVSVVTIVYNGSKYLEKTIESVISQIYANVEYIIIDGGSLDGTLDIIRKYENKIDYWISEPDKGISDAFNKGVRVANGEWLNFLNAGDCYVSKETIKNISVYFGQKQIITGFSRSGNGKCPRKQKNNTDALHVRSRISHQASFIKKDVFLKKGNFSEEYKIRMDYDFWMRVLKEFEFFFVNDFFVLFDTGGASGADRELFYQEELIINSFHLENGFFVNLVVKCKYYIEKLFGRRIIVKLLDKVS